MNNLSKFVSAWLIWPKCGMCSICRGGRNVLNPLPPIHACLFKTLWGILHIATFPRTSNSWHFVMMHDYSTFWCVKSNCALYTCIMYLQLSINIFLIIFTNSNTHKQHILDYLVLCNFINKDKLYWMVGKEPLNSHHYNV